MSTELKTVELDQSIVASVALNGDLSKLQPAQKVQYVTALCQRLGLDPVTQPLKLMKLNGREIVYADRGCAAQLNRLHGVSSEITKAEQIGDLFMVYGRAITPDKRFTDEIAAVPTTGLKGEALANAYMKCRTKAMRRATLTHVGLGLLDESEVDTIPQAQKVEVQQPEFEWTDKQRQDAYTYLDLTSTLVDEITFNKRADEVKAAIAAGEEPEGVLRRLMAYNDRAAAKKAKADA